MDRLVLWTLAGVVAGAASAVVWLAPRPPAPRPDAVALAWTPPRVPVPAGRRGVVVDAGGAPAPFVDVFLTELGPELHRIYPAVRTNFEGHFPIVVPPGRYRVQGLFIDEVVEIPAASHPDIRVRVVPRPLLQFLGTPP